MRTSAEIAFRARQEAANLYLLAAKPKFSRPAPSSLALPDPAPIASALKESKYAASVLSIAERILTHRFPLLATEIETGPRISWRRDYAHERESGLSYFKRIPYLDFSVVGDHKFVWELNRHQHLVLLAQAFRLTGEADYLTELFAQLESWLAQNPYQRGINWTSALEVAFRALSWIWVYHLVNSEMPGPLKKSVLTALYRHGRHLRENLSVYFSPNTHLLGEAVALYAIATLFPQFPGSRAWQAHSSKIVLAQLDFQMKKDGSHFEQSTYYHVYAVDFFLFFYLLAGRPERMKPELIRMAEYLYCLLGPNRTLTFLGDDDGGRMFHPYGRRDCFGRATLATCGIVLEREDWIGSEDDLAEQAAWWLGADALHFAKRTQKGSSESRFFEDSGSLFLRSAHLFLQMDCGPFGFGGAGHSHSDTLSLTLQSPRESILVDPGTYTYMGDPAERNWFRGSAAHNTVRVNRMDQAKPLGPFRWSSKPEVEMFGWRKTADGGAADAECRYSDIRHRRKVLLQGRRLVVLDEVEGWGDLSCEQIWQLGGGASGFAFSSSGAISAESSWFSPGYGSKTASTALIVKQAGESLVKIVTVISPDEEKVPTSQEVAELIDRILS